MQQGTINTFPEHVPHVRRNKIVLYNHNYTVESFLYTAGNVILSFCCFNFIWTKFYDKVGVFTWTFKIIMFV